MLGREFALLLLAIGLASPMAACGVRSDSAVRINEVMPANLDVAADERGESDDWIELYNGTAEAIDLAGYTLTDDTNASDKAVLGAGLSLPAGGTLVFWADDSVDQGARHLPFKLSAPQGVVALYDPDGKRVDQAGWTDAASNTSLARLPDGSGEFAWCAQATCGALNGSTCGGN